MPGGFNGNVVEKGMLILLNCILSLHSPLKAHVAHSFSHPSIIQEIFTKRSTIPADLSWQRLQALFPFPSR